jgi:DNA-binding LacI/PurR family transcriptional regulator
MPRRVILKDIAARLDVSVSAVSQALRNDPSISGPQRERIQNLAKSLGYRPDPGLTALSAYRLKSGIRPAFASIAFMGFSPYGHDWTDIFFNGAKERAEQLGYDLSHYYLSPDLPVERHCRILHSRGVRGLIVAPLLAGMTTINFDWSLFSVIAIGRSLVQPELNRASPDAFESLLLAVEKVRQLGYKDIGVAITQEQDIRAGWSWSAAVAVLQGRKRLAGERIVFFEGPAAEPTRFLSWLKQKKPSVVITQIAPVPDWIRKAGYAIPQDLALVCLDYYPEVTCPAIEQNFKKVGAAGMSLLHSSLIQGETGIPEFRQTLLIKPQWVTGLLRS